MGGEGDGRPESGDLLVDEMLAGLDEDGGLPGEVRADSDDLAPGGAATAIGRFLTLSKSLKASYPEDLFPPITAADVAGLGDLPGRVSAQTGRHIASLIEEILESVKNKGKRA